MTSCRPILTWLAVASVGMGVVACAPTGAAPLNAVQGLFDMGVPSGFSTVEFNLSGGTELPLVGQAAELTYQTSLLRTLAASRAACSALARYIDEFRHRMLSASVEEKGLDVPGCTATLAPFLIGPLDTLPVPSALPISLWEENGVKHAHTWAQHAEYVDAGEFKLLRITVSGEPLAVEGNSGS